MNLHLVKPLLLVLFCGLLWSACNKPSLFEGNVEIPEKEWSYDNLVPFGVNIADTTTRYDVFLNIRHTNEYAFRNMYVYVHTKYPSGKQLKSRVDLPLAEDSGKWYGTGNGDIRSAEIQIQSNAIFPEAGDYIFAIEQNMRLNPLPNIMDVGLRIAASAQ